MLFFTLILDNWIKLSSTPNLENINHRDAYGFNNGNLMRTPSEYVKPFTILLKIVLNIWIALTSPGPQYSLYSSPSPVAQYSLIFIFPWAFIRFCFLEPRRVGQDIQSGLRKFPSSSRGLFDPTFGLSRTSENYGIVERMITIAKIYLVLFQRKIIGTKHLSEVFRLTGLFLLKVNLK